MAIVGPSSLQEWVVARARIKMNLTAGNMGYKFTDFVDVAEFLAVGTTPTDAGTYGAAVTCTTGTGANATSGYSAGVRAYAGGAGEKFYIAGRAKITTAVTSNLIAGIGAEASGMYTGSDFIVVGVRASSSTTLYAAKIGSQAATSTIAIDTAYHTFEVWGDGSAQYICVDYETPVAFGSTGNPGAACYLQVGANTGSSGAATTLVVDWACWAWGRS